MQQRYYQSQRDFAEQKGRLQEEVEAAGHSVIFYPKFHCELNFIERFWCASKHYARENCEYNLNSLRKTLPAAFKSVSTASINRYYQHCCRIIEAYIDGHKYGTEAFVERAYKSHRRVSMIIVCFLLPYHTNITLCFSLNTCIILYQYINTVHNTLTF